MAEEAAAAAEKVVEAVQEAVNGTQAKVDLNVNSRIFKTKQWKCYSRSEL